ncbi:uncharacterized protein LOC123523229 [Mercenaria mercenaria]|uniref:uncharacterized protein LOC123523229 n=1 Tax=Mercenaria mercenaria TaxID=6596 RepID=UPI00234F4A4A|nr:uncharacterized protein LOC123523229 [Mercenaria mercenaria]
MKCKLNYIKCCYVVVTMASFTTTCGIMYFYSESGFLQMWNKENTTSELSKNTNATYVNNYVTKQYSNSSYLLKRHFLSKSTASSIPDLVDMIHNFKLNNITVKSEKECQRHKFIVYSCDYSRSCGGLGDRQRGIVSLFLLALLTSRAFVISSEKPCALENVLKPHLYDWSVCKSFVNTIETKDSKMFDFVDRAKLFNANQNFDKWRWKVVFIKINFHLFYQLRKRKDVRDHIDWLVHMSKWKAVNTVLQILFKPTQTSLDYLQQFDKHEVKGKTLVCSHIRTGKNPSIPEDSLFRTKPDETIIFDFLKKYIVSSKYVLYLATDSDSIRQAFFKMFENSIKMNITIVHIDRLGKYEMFQKQACEGLKFAVIEQYILSVCDILILTKSGFGTTAAYIRGKSDQLYMFHPIKRRVVLSDLRNI